MGSPEWNETTWVPEGVFFARGRSRSPDYVGARQVMGVRARGRYFASAVCDGASLCEVVGYHQGCLSESVEGFFEHG